VVVVLDVEVDVVFVDVVVGGGGGGLVVEVVVVLVVGGGEGGRDCIRLPPKEVPSFKFFS
jgi:hypothetical protein